MYFRKVHKDAVCIEAFFSGTYIHFRNGFRGIFRNCRAFPAAIPFNRPHDSPCRWIYDNSVLPDNDLLKGGNRLKHPGFFKKTVFAGLLLLPVFHSGIRASDGGSPVTLFSDSIAPGWHSYTSGGRTACFVEKDAQKRQGSVIRISFDDRVYGASAGISAAHGRSIGNGLTRRNTCVRFRVRGLLGGEQFHLGILDAGDRGNNRVTVRCRSRDWFTVGTDWQEASVPLSAFPDWGNRWYDREKALRCDTIDWNAINGIVWATGKELNLGRCDSGRIATVFLDDIRIEKADTPSTSALFSAWNLFSDSIVGPQHRDMPDTITFFKWLDTALAPYTFIYPYGEPTDFTILKPPTSGQLPVLAAYFNDDEWSGITLARGSAAPVNIQLRRENGAVEFMVRGACGGEQFTIGLLDDESDGTDRKIQSSVSSRTYVKVSREWQRVRIPFSDFSDFGRWWHTDAHYEVNGKIDWTRIAEIRFSTDQYGNAAIAKKAGNPVRLYFSDIRFVENCDVFSNGRYWKHFSSALPDTVFERFDDPGSISRWSTSTDPKTEITTGWGINRLDGSRAVRIDYTVHEWGSAIYGFGENDTVSGNWAGYCGLSFDFYSSRPSQVCRFLFTDQSNEAWYTRFPVKMGWQRVTLPFGKFSLFEWWQPDSAVFNGRMDLDRVQSYDLQPGQGKNSGTLMIDNLTLTNNIQDGTLRENRIRYNQLGYERNAPKRFLVADSAEHEFTVFDRNENPLFTGTLDSGARWDLSEEYLRQGSLAGAAAGDTLSLLLPGSGERQQIRIGSDIYGMPFRAALKAFYFQRSGMALEKQFAGRWTRPAGHPDTACSLHVSTGKTGIINVGGGWYDAGDYGKYIVPAGVSVWLLLALHDHFPHSVSDSLSLPESGNGVSDLLDEVRFEIEWMKRMQDVDGGVFFKVGTTAWDGFSMPHECTAPRYVIGKSTASTLDFAASTAKAARVYRTVDRSFSDDCRGRALRAWQWATANPDIREPSETGGTGVYGDNAFNDEFFWAACELYLTTGKKEFRKYLSGHAASGKLADGASWNRVGNFGLFSLIAHRRGLKLAITPDIRREIITAADRLVSAINRHPCRIPTEQFIWGSNDVLLNQAVTCCHAYIFTGKTAYRNAVLDVADYLFGRNATGYSFVTGFGERSPRNPHHRIMGSDDVDEPFPGFLVGGPNGVMQDAARGEPGVYYPKTAPACAYIDRVESYASNEIAITWNAALVFVLGFLSQTR